MTIPALKDYGVLGDGRTIALVSSTGSIDWLCAPSLDSAPLFDAVLNAGTDSIFSVVPAGDYEVSHRYAENSNVIITEYRTLEAHFRITRSLNSGVAGRLPWMELATRIECLAGEGDMDMRFTLDDTQWQLYDDTGAYTNGSRLLNFISDHTSLPICMSAGQKSIIGIIVTEGQPQVLPDAQAIDARIDASDQAWRRWATQLTVEPAYAAAVTRSALALKLLLHSPTGAIAAAGTTSLPERIGGDKNFDYRFAWIRDTAYIIKAFIRIGLEEEVQAGMNWLMKIIGEHINDLDTLYTLEGKTDRTVEELDLPGYKNSRPVLRGNKAATQKQFSMYGDILETVTLFAESGNIVDPRTIDIIGKVLEKCAADWHRPDSGIWELEEQAHYTISKIGCWLAFDRAVRLCKLGALPAEQKTEYLELKATIERYIETECWSDERQAYTMIAGGDKLDASLLLTTRFGYSNKERLYRTMRAIQRELSDGTLVYRYSDADKEEGTFTACGFWLVEALAFLGEPDEAKSLMDRLLTRTCNSLGIMSEMIDPRDDSFLGNLPQGLSHLAMIHAADALKNT